MLDITFAYYDFLGLSITTWHLLLLEATLHYFKSIEEMTFQRQSPKSSLMH